MGAGSSIAVQNFNENLSILAMQGIYAVLIAFRMPILYVIIMFGATVAAIMFLIRFRHQRNLRHGDLSHLIVTEGENPKH